MRLAVPKSCLSRVFRRTLLQMGISGIGRARFHKINNVMRHAKWKSSTSRRTTQQPRKKAKKKVSSLLSAAALLPRDDLRDVRSPSKGQQPTFFLFFPHLLITLESFLFRKVFVQWGNVTRRLSTTHVHPRVRKYVHTYGFPQYGGFRGRGRWHGGKRRAIAKTACLLFVRRWIRIYIACIFFFVKIDLSIMISSELDFGYREMNVASPVPNTWIGHRSYYIGYAMVPGLFIVYRKHLP